MSWTVENLKFNTKKIKNFYLFIFFLLLLTSMKHLYQMHYYYYYKSYVLYKNREEFINIDETFYNLRQLPFIGPQIKNCSWRITILYRVQLCDRHQEVFAEKKTMRKNDSVFKDLCKTCEHKRDSSLTIIKLLNDKFLLVFNIILDDSTTIIKNQRGDKHVMQRKLQFL